MLTFPFFGRIINDVDSTSEPDNSPYGTLRQQRGNDARKINF